MYIEYLSGSLILDLGIPLFFALFIATAFMLGVVIYATFRKQEFKQFSPKVSIIIPCYNEEEYIGRCIEAVLKSDYSNDIEVLCVDDGSTDSSMKIISSYDVKLLKQKHKGKVAALNLAVSKASYDYILSLDADTVIPRNFLKNLIRPLKDKKIGATNGLPVIHEPSTLLEFYQDVEYRFNNIIRHGFSKVFSNGIWFFGAAACYRKEFLEKNPFKMDVLTEDMDMSLNLAAHGYDVITVEQHYFTKGCKSLQELFAQRMRWFYGGLQAIYNHRKIWKKTVPILFLFTNQIIWSVFSVFAPFIFAYQIWYWLPDSGIAFYLFRWFSLLGPIFVLVKLNEWGLSFVSIFGVLSGILSTVTLLMSNIKAGLRNLMIIFFYFPYTLLLNVILIAGLIKYSFKEKKFIH